VTLPVDPSMSDVLDDESDEQASDQDSTSCSFVLDPFDAVIGEEKLCMRE